MNQEGVNAPCAFDGTAYADNVVVIVNCVCASEAPAAGLVSDQQKLAVPPYERNAYSLTCWSLQRANDITPVVNAKGYAHVVAPW
jgi:hypothetical protein